MMLTSSVDVAVAELFNRNKVLEAENAALKLEEASLRSTQQPQPAICPVAGMSCRFGTVQVFCSRG